jgi:hypothetical protein
MTRRGFLSSALLLLVGRKRPRRTPPPPSLTDTAYGLGLFGEGTYGY